MGVMRRRRSTRAGHSRRAQSDRRGAPRIAAGPHGGHSRSPTSPGPGLPRFLQTGSTPVDHDPSMPARPANQALAASPDGSGHANALQLPNYAGLHPPPPCCEDLEQAKLWSGRSFGPRDITGAGGRGGFTAWYFPFGGPGVLSVVQNIAAEFKDTLIVDAGKIVPHPDLPAGAQMTALATAIDHLPEPQRSARLANYQWGTGHERVDWLSDLESVIEDAWGFEHEFFLNRPCWDWLGAEVNVDIRPHLGPRTAGDHMELETYKTPPGESLRTHGVSHRVAHGSGNDAHDQHMRLASTTTGPKEYDLLRSSVQFAHDSTALDASARSTLDDFIDEYDGASAHAAFSRARIDLIGRASSSGSAGYNHDLSERRAEAVRAYLVAHGLTDADLRVKVDAQGESAANQASDDAADRRVDLLVDGGQRMVTATHEFGHAFGLGDEYATSSTNIGDDAGHHDLARAMTRADGSHLPGAAVEHTGGIMSYGNEVRPQHYATFHHALETVTGESPWSLGTRTDLADTEAMCDGEGLPPCTGDTCLATAAESSTQRPTLA